MSTTRPLIWRNSNIAAKAETTTGSAIALANTDCAFMVEEPRLQQVSVAAERAYPGSMSRSYSVPGTQAGKFTFRTAMQGSGTNGTDGNIFSVLLAGCGFAGSSHVYSPTSNPLTTLTMACYTDGRTKKIIGAQGKCKITGKAAQEVMMAWEFDGAWVAPTEAAPPSSISYPTVVPPRFAGGTFTIGGTTYNISEFELNLDMKVQMRADPANSNGWLSAIIVDRNITFSCDPEALSLSTQDWNAAYIGETTSALSLQIGAGSSNGNTIVIAAPYMQLDKAPEDGDRGGIITDKLVFGCKSADGLDDELTFTLS